MKIATLRLEKMTELCPNVACACTKASDLVLTYNLILLFTFVLRSKSAMRS